ncbi:GNAT family N-acetyltransferase [Bradyrhizobium sp.]|uniref:GNAT family N-acetyltransferase n=1 Tax=Bradyrhizobium sp. TaxID=376 RepID=UPI001ED670D9|nr:GNAT family N-acetyltransferase [Bradyrhizobium sp.]MBV9983088.1 GNAT family N-acetyltransferase [Bradyrhizobium sp.]
MESLSRLFSDNLTPQYISHSELQGYRALKPEQWAENIETVIREEIGSRLGQPRQTFPSGQAWQGVIQAREDDRLVGVALVTISRSAAVPFGVIEDIVVGKGLRDGGRGRALMEWIAAEMLRAGITRLFLESGIGNERAHRLFEGMGFKPISVVMMRELL